MIVGLSGASAVITEARNGCQEPAPTLETVRP